MVPINNIPALVQIMAWRCPGNKSLSEPMMVSLPMHIQGSTLIFKVTCPFGQVRFEIHLSCMRCHLSTNPNPCRNMGIVQFCATIFDFSSVPSDKWHCKTTCPRSHFQHFYLSWTVGQPLRSSPDICFTRPQ